jgi:hypothetical protein
LTGSRPVSISAQSVVALLQLVSFCVGLMSACRSLLLLQIASKVYASLYSHKLKITARSKEIINRKIAPLTIEFVVLADLTVEANSIFYVWIKVSEFLVNAQPAMIDRDFY